MEHYNAFISYKHAEEDNIVAEAVHKGLERFHIPSKIREKTGIKKINRIFRDKDELPITSDLSDTIANALADSDYLIVICSTNTKQSAWVPREIEYFLKNHTKKQIFTVLVNGEPYDVIPEILQYEEKTVKDENGNDQTVKIPMEPLSCDYRIPLSKAKKTELPRLASGIIGCAYDELMNRHRAYRIKQLTAVFSIVLAVMLAFCGYMFYSNKQIRKNYLESLRNQSKYLANESANLLEKEQRITALQLALEALPKDKSDDRPVTAEAVRALTDATLAYRGSNGNNINAAWNYTMPGIVKDFKISPDGGAIALFDEGNAVGVWDTENHEELLYLDGVYPAVRGIDFVDEDKLAVWTDSTLSCYGLDDKELKWEHKLEFDSYGDDDSFMLGNNAVYISTSNSRFLKFDPATGDITGKYPLADDPEDDYVPEPTYSVAESKLSPDGKKIAFRTIMGWNSYAYGVYDIESRKLLISDPMDETIKDIDWVNANYFCLASSVVDMSSSMSIGSKELISTDHSEIRCIRASDLSLEWRQDFDCNGVMIRSGFSKLGKNVAYYSGNVISVYDIKTGVLQYTNNVNDPVVDVSDIDGDGEPLYITENGGYACPAHSVDSDAVYYDKYFTDELRQVEISNGVYARQQYGCEVIFYGAHVYDEDWTCLYDEVALPDYISDHYLNDEYLLTLTDDDDANEAVLDIFKLGEEPEHFDVGFSNRDAFDYKILGIDRNMAYLGYDDEGMFTLISIDLDSKEVEEKKLFDPASSFADAGMLADGKLIYAYSKEDYKTAACVYDVNEDKKTEISLPDEAGYMKHAPVYYDEINAAYLAGGGEYVLDLETKQVIEPDMPEEWSGGICFSDNCLDGTFALSDGKSMILMDKSGEISLTIACPGLTPVGMAFCEEELFVLYNDGSLYTYLVRTGEFLKKTDATMYYNYIGDASFEFDKENGYLYIQMDKLTDVIDLESKAQFAYIETCFGHDKVRDRFITMSKDSEGNEKVGYFKHYTVDELIDKAHDILKGAELSEETKTRYGID